MPKHKQITVIGNVGSGKTTLTKLLAGRLPAKKIPADSLFRINPFFSLALKDRKRWSLASDLWFLYKRLELVRQVPRLLVKSHVIVDSGLLMSFVYTHSRLRDGYFSKDEWELYHSLYKELTVNEKSPDMVIYLQAPVAFLRKRIKERGRKFEIKNHSKDYLNNLNKSLKKVVKELKMQGTKVIAIKADKVDFVKRGIDLMELAGKIL